MTPTGVLGRNLRSLPKAHLHLHLEAAMRYDTLAELSAPLGLPVPPLVDVQDFSTFARSYFNVITVLTNGDNLRRAIDEMVQDAAEQGVVYLELATLPQYFAPRFGTAEAALLVMLEQARRSAETWAVEVGLMVTIDRADTAEAATELATLAARYADAGVVGLGLANDEIGNPAERFVDAFAIAKAAGLKSTPHAGELDGPESIRSSLDSLKADRIQHGIRAVEDADLMDRLVSDGICLDICPTSNVQLAVVSSLAVHPLRRLIESGVRCTINADDPTLFGSNLNDEFELCRTELGLSDRQLAECALNSINFSSATEQTKAAARAGVSTWLAVEPR